MKLAGFLALVLAVVLGVWSAMDYYHNEHQRRVAVEELKSALSRELGGGPAAEAAVQEINQAVSDKRYDAIIGIVGFCALISSVAMFSKSKK